MVGIVTLNAEIESALNALVRYVEVKVFFTTGTEGLIITADAIDWALLTFKCCIEEESSLTNGAVSRRCTANAVGRAENT